jgi:WD40 repeat protein
LKFWASDAAAPLRYSEEAVVRRPHDAQVTALAFHPGDSEVLASVASDGSLKIWKGGSSKRLKKTDGSPGGRQWLCLLEADVSKGALSSLAFSGCGTVLALGGQGAVVLWDFEQSRELGLLRGGDEGVAFWKLLFCAADSTLVGLQPNSVVVWDLETRCVRHAFRLPAMAACAVDGTVFLATPSSALVGATPAPAVAPPTPTKKDKKKKDKKKKTDEGEAPEAGTPSQGTCVLSIAAGEPRAVAWLQDAVVDVFSRHGSGAKGAQGLIFATEDRRFLTLTS